MNSNITVKNLIHFDGQFKLTVHMFFIQSVFSVILIHFYKLNILLDDILIFRVVKKYTKPYIFIESKLDVQ